LLAKDLGIPVLALSQLSRAVELRTDKRPVLADLRESGSLEQDADVVLFLYRDEVYDPESEHKGKAELLLRKQRNGAIGEVWLAFLARLATFKSLAVPAAGQEAEG
jgi:replicative DNA helicase